MSKYLKGDKYAKNIPNTIGVDAAKQKKVFLDITKDEILYPNNRMKSMFMFEVKILF